MESGNEEGVRVQCHAIKVKSKTIQRIKSRNCNIIDDMSRRQFSKLDILVQMFRAKLWSLVLRYGSQKIT